MVNNDSPSPSFPIEIPYPIVIVINGTVIDPSNRIKTNVVSINAQSYI